MEEIKDWRGTPIRPGDYVVMAAQSGHCVNSVEGWVVRITETGRIRIKVIRRSRGMRSWQEDEITATPKIGSLTVVTALPESSAPTLQDIKDQAKARRG